MILEIDVIEASLTLAMAEMEKDYIDNPEYNFHKAEDLYLDYDEREFLPELFPIFTAKYDYFVEVISNYATKL
jgi:hypothetical protein